MHLQPPSEQQLSATFLELLALPAGAQRALGGGIYLRLDNNCNYRFVYRWRGYGQERSKTFDSWEKAAYAATVCEAIERLVEEAAEKWF